MTTTVLDPEQAQHEDAQRNAAAIYREERRRYWDEFAQSLDQWQRVRGYYQRRLADVYKHLIPPNMRVLELGCGQGDLLNALQPSRGVGVDLSGNMLERARAHYPHLQFYEGDVQDALPAEKFDFIILSDLVNDVRDVQRALELVNQCCLPTTRIIMNAYSRLWQGPRWMAEMMGAAKLQLTRTGSRAKTSRIFSISPASKRSASFPKSCGRCEHSASIRSAIAIW